jgi:hypothetical protein
MREGESDGGFRLGDEKDFRGDKALPSSPFKGEVRKGMGGIIGVV